MLSVARRERDRERERERERETDHHCGFAYTVSYKWLKKKLYEVNFS
jgi:hypothetical protein